MLVSEWFCSLSLSFSFSFSQGLEKFENDTSLLIAVARIHEVCGFKHFHSQVYMVTYNTFLPPPPSLLRD